MLCSLRVWWKIMNGRNKQNERETDGQNWLRERKWARETEEHALSLSKIYLKGEVWGVNWRHRHQACLWQQIPAASVIKKDRCVQGRFWAPSFRPLRFYCCSAPREMTAVMTCVCVCVCVCQPTDSRHSQPVSTLSPHFISCLCCPYPSIDLWIKDSTERCWAWKHWQME